MEKLKLYEALIWDGGSRHDSSGVFFNNIEAAIDFKNHFKYDSYSERNIVIVGSLEGYIDHKHGTERQMALDKLTWREKEILGLK